MSIPPLGNVAFLGIPWYSILIVAGMAAGAFLAVREEPRLGLPRDSVLDTLLLAIPVAIIGARLYYVAFEWELFRGDPLRILRVREGGLAVYGGIIGGLLAAFVMSRIKRVSFVKILDACAPSLMLGQAIGRWGNYANMEAYGLAVNDPRWQWFPFAVRIPIDGRWQWFMATFFYESIWCFIGFIILRRMRRRLARSGDVFLWYVLLY
ncbi:MAG: prolipoprotein diacylglyceryl transferase, partial [Oscillospiraceae bacterium]|nr:prolipoprotein diacylglyceryl transferase [Oscillospiraceae bacterium]